MSRHPAKTGVRLVEEGPVEIPARDLFLQGDLAVPESARGLVVFAHGSGSSRQSPRNQAVARGLRDAGLATLLIDLLTGDEDRTSSRGVDPSVLVPRLEAATEWGRGHPGTLGLPLGYFGASTGAAVALLAAADLGPDVKAVVSRGGRPDLADSVLAEVRSPTLLIVGSLDGVVLDLNRQSLARLGCAERELAIVRGATHLFEEPGALEEVTRLSGRWFRTHLTIR